jgi:hypothetical protein
MFNGANASLLIVIPKFVAFSAFVFKYYILGVAMSFCEVK